ncbi:MAG: copper resistance protein CopC, partial [Chloroflexota bacterium]
MRSNPAADARLVRAPKEVRAAFSEQPDPRGSELAVFDTSGKRVDAGGTAASDEPNGLRVSLAAIGDGGYTVAWTVLSTVDGHTTRGSFAFAVGDAPLPKIADVGQEVSPPAPFELAGRFLSFAGIALALGVAAFGLAVRAFADAPAQRREQLVLALAGGLLVAGSVALLLDQGGRAPPRLTALLGIRGLAGVTILGGAAAFAPTRLRLVALAAGVVAAMTATLVSHAAATGGARDVALDLAHLLAVSVWAGGVVAMLAIAIPSSSDGDADLGRTVWRFSLVALASVGALVATGTLQAFDRLVLIEDLVETPYGIALLAKIVLLAITLVLGALNLLAWGPRLRAAADA